MFVVCQTLFAASTKIIDHGPVLEVYLVCEEPWNRNRDRVRGSTVKDEMPSAAWETRECFMEQYIWVESSTWNPCSFCPPPISFTSTWSTFLLIYYTPETLAFFCSLNTRSLLPSQCLASAPRPAGTSSPISSITYPAQCHLLEAAIPHLPSLLSHSLHMTQFCLLCMYQHLTLSYAIVYCLSSSSRIKLSSFRTVTCFLSTV